jgi:hypothetical protein
MTLLVRQMEDISASRRWREGGEWRQKSGFRNLTFILLVMLVSTLASPALCAFGPGNHLQLPFVSFSSYSMFQIFFPFPWMRFLNESSPALI